MSFSVPLTSFFNDVKICVTSYFMYRVSHEGKYCTFNKILVRKRIKHQTRAGKISIGLQLGGPSLETRNLSLGCLRFFRLALLPVLDPLYHGGLSCYVSDYCILPLFTYFGEYNDVKSRNVSILYPQSSFM